MAALLEPGMMVRHPGQPDWGLGQVQSNINGRATVNFEHAVNIGLTQARMSAPQLQRRGARPMTAWQNLPG
jgi:Protein of unknown function (DUF3553)